VQTSLAPALKTNSIPLANGETHDFKGIRVESFPMYNFSTQNHIKGVGNGYILTIGGKRFYIGGDTEDTPEMRALRDLEVAFIPMNLPFTMSVNKAAEAVKLMKPRIVFPYHYSGSDVNTFKRLMGTDTGIEVRLRRWY
jgi:L-ascorbate metabolism protein UlaG (beta-lactamase superfamily)